MSRREEILAKISSVPSLPPAAMKVVRMLQDPNVGIADVARVLEHDPGLTTNVLRLANSAYFGGARSVSSVRDAGVRLGTKRLLQMAIASGVSNLVRSEVKGYDLAPGKLWEHSAFVAIAAVQLAQALRTIPPDHTFTAALVHDVGKIVLGTFVEVDAAPIMQLAFQEKVSFEIAERSVLGIDHAEVGAALLKSWRLPDDIVCVARWHHHPEQFQEQGAQVVNLVHVADTLSMMEGIGIGNDGLNYRSCHDLALRMGVTTRVSESVVCRTMTEMEPLLTLFNNNRGR